ncbi:MAG: ATP-binding cassette domain-containing protein [Bacteroidales bacterium]|nr:ATP-binding cassette domain-containing protein [Bacteroidales bacterium]
MIVVKNISKSFGDNHVLTDISLTCKKGETNLIIGESGSGKTVLLKSILGIHEIDKGQIIYGDDVFTEMNHKEKQKIRQEIGMVFQGGALFDSSTVFENIIFPLQMFSDMNKKEMSDRVRFCLDRVNLHNVDDLYPSEISGGMQKRVAIARAIVLNPKYLFFDEPNSGLDPKTAIIIDNLIKELTIDFNTVTVINTHDMNSVAEIGDNIAFIYNGEKWWTGNKEEIMHTDNKELNEFVFATELMRGLKNS